MGIYEFLIAWGYTTIISFGVDAITRVRTMKIMADRGYKLNNENMKIVKRRTKVIGNDKSLTLLVPFYNMVLSLRSLAEAIISKELIMEKLETLKVIKQMTKEERKNYREKPSYFNALKINKDSQKKEKMEEIEFYKQYSTPDVQVIKTSQCTRQKVKSITSKNKNMVTRNEKLSKKTTDAEKNNNQVTGTSRAERIESASKVRIR